MNIKDQIAEEVKETLYIDLGFSLSDAEDLVLEHIYHESPEPRISQYVNEMLEGNSVDFFKTLSISDILKNYRED